MKGLLRAGSVCLILGALLLAGRSWSETKKEARRPRSRIALLNLSHVIRNYDKFKNYQKAMKAAVAPFSAKEKAIRAELEKLNKEEFEVARTARRGALQQELEDLKNKFQTTMARKQGKQLKTLYKDIQEAARRYAQAHDIELVLHYNDASDKKDYWSEANVARKMQAGACMPLYAADGLDISKEILTMLNEKLRRRKS
jgi:Skp family chaperone for outer membrane proteins